MLILDITKGKAIVINDDIYIRVLEVNGGHVRLGFEAPKTIPIFREEIYEKIQLEKKSAKQKNNPEEL